MKKITTGFIIGIVLLSSLIVGQLVLDSQRDLVLTNDKKTALEEVNIDKFIYTDTIIDGEYCSFKICYEREVILTDLEEEQTIAIDLDCPYNPIYRCIDYKKEILGDYYVNLYAQELIKANQTPNKLNDSIEVTVKSAEEIPIK